MAGATYMVALRGHVLGSMAGATSLRGHILEFLAGGTYRVALEEHISGGLVGASYGWPPCVYSWRARLRRDLAAGTPPQSTLLPLISFSLQIIGLSLEASQRALAEIFRIDSV